MEPGFPGAGISSSIEFQVIVFLYELLQKGELCSLLDGVFAFALVADGDFLAAR